MFFFLKYVLQMNIQRCENSVKTKIEFYNLISVKAFLRIATRAFEAYIKLTESVSLSNWSFCCKQLKISIIN